MSRSFKWAKLLLNMAEFYFIQFEFFGGVLLAILLSPHLNQLATSRVYFTLHKLGYWCWAAGSLLVYEINCRSLLWKGIEGRLRKYLPSDCRGRARLKAERCGTVSLPPSRSWRLRWADPKDGVSPPKLCTNCQFGDESGGALWEHDGRSGTISS